MTFAYPLSGLVTLAALLLYLAFGGRVGSARGRLGVHAPATTGHPEFERLFRIHQNTLEQIVLFLPALWLAAVVASDRWAAALGVVWLVGRLVYARAYAADPAGRGPGILITLGASLGLAVMALVGIVRGLYS